MAMKLLKEKNIILTGASRGLGAATAHAMWNAGANLLLVGRFENTLLGVKNSLESSTENGQTIDIMAADLDNPRSAKVIIDFANKIWHRVDVLINNAAVVGPIGKAWETDWQQWESSFRTNLFSPVQLCRECIPWMKGTGGGKIINISGGGATGPRPNFTAYAVAKTALVRFTEILAQEVAELNIQVNAIAPGMMNTEMTKAVLNAGEDKAGQKEFYDAMKLTATGEGAIQKAAALCVFLASSKSDEVTGKLLSAIWDPWENIQEYINDLNSTDIYTLRRIVPKDRGKTWG